VTSPRLPADQVTLDFRDLPPGLSAEDNATGARLSLDQLARRFSRRSDPGRKLHSWGRNEALSPETIHAVAVECVVNC